MRQLQVNLRERKRVDRLVEFYKEKQDLVSLFLKQVLAALEEPALPSTLVHSIKSRIKDPDHLRDKLHRKIVDARRRRMPFRITNDNLMVKVNDLAGIRILHLHTHQIAEIDKRLKGIFGQQNFTLIEGPFAHTWDDESRKFFRGIGIQTHDSDSLYTSVHYVIESASRSPVTCEIQVRTLMEEVWGQVNHTINYPYPINSVACREQIRALARATSTATSLVDSIFATVADMNRQGK